MEVPRFYLNLQEKTTREASNSEKYGLTSNERSFFRKLLGYEGEQRHKSISTAGWYTREALKLGSETSLHNVEDREKETLYNVEDKEKETKKEDLVGDRMNEQTQIPSIFSQVMYRVKYQSVRSAVTRFTCGFVGLNFRLFLVCNSRVLFFFAITDGFLVLFCFVFVCNSRVLFCFCL